MNSIDWFFMNPGRTTYIRKVNEDEYLVIRKWPNGEIEERDCCAIVKIYAGGDIVAVENPEVNADEETSCVWWDKSENVAGIEELEKLLTGGA